MTFLERRRFFLFFLTPFGKIKEGFLSIARNSNLSGSFPQSLQSLTALDIRDVAISRRLILALRPTLLGNSPIRTPRDGSRIKKRDLIGHAPAFLKPRYNFRYSCFKQYVLCFCFRYEFEQKHDSTKTQFSRTPSRIVILWTSHCCGRCHS